MRRALVLSAGLLAAACITTRFEHLDPSYEPKESATAPQVTEPQAVPEQYRTVGVLEVLHNNTTDPKAIVEKARDEGRALGCGLLIREAPPEAVDKVEVTVVLGPSPSMQSEETNRVRYLCAVEKPRQ